MINQQAILKQLQTAWEEAEFNDQQKTNFNEAKIRFPSTGRSHADFSHFQGWNQSYHQKSFQRFKQKQQIKRMSFHFLSTQNKFYLPTSVSKRGKSKEQKSRHTPSVIMMGSPVSGMSLKSKYFISDKEKGSFKIEDAENIRKRGGRLYVKSCEDRNIKQKSPRQKRQINAIKFRKGTKINNTQFRTTKNTYHKCIRNNKLQALKIV